MALTKLAPGDPNQHPDGRGNWYDGDDRVHVYDVMGLPGQQGDAFTNARLYAMLLADPKEPAHAMWRKNIEFGAINMALSALMEQETTGTEYRFTADELETFRAIAVAHPEINLTRPDLLAAAEAEA
jgi:hypothetical protein